MAGIVDGSGFAERHALDVLWRFVGIDGPDAGTPAGRRHLHSRQGSGLPRAVVPVSTTDGTRRERRLPHPPRSGRCTGQFR